MLAVFESERTVQLYTACLFVSCFRDDDSDEGSGNLSARSSLGILPVDALDGT